MIVDDPAKLTKKSIKRLDRLLRLASSLIEPSLGDTLLGILHSSSNTELSVAIVGLFHLLPRAPLAPLVQVIVTKRPHSIATRVY
jgi:hypothetical protein